MSWSLGVGPVEQGAVRDALEAERDKVAESYGGFSDAARSQQDAVFAAAETLVDKAEFGGSRVVMSASGHVADPAQENDRNYAALTVSEEAAG